MCCRACTAVRAGTFIHDQSWSTHTLLSVPGGSSAASCCFASTARSSSAGGCCRLLNKSCSCGSICCLNAASSGDPGGAAAAAARCCCSWASTGAITVWWRVLMSSMRRFRGRPCCTNRDASACKTASAGQQPAQHSACRCTQHPYMPRMHPHVHTQSVQATTAGGLGWVAFTATCCMCA